LSFLYDSFATPLRKKENACNSDAGVVFRYSNGHADNGTRRKAYATVAIKTTTSPDVASEARRCAPLITEPLSLSLVVYVHPFPHFLRVEVCCARWTVLHAVVCVRLLAIDSDTIPGWRDIPENDTLCYIDARYIFPRFLTELK